LNQRWKLKQTAAALNGVALEDLVDDAKRLAVGDERPVDDDRIGRRAEDQRVTCRTRARRGTRGSGSSSAEDHEGSE